MGFGWRGICMALLFVTSSVAVNPSPGGWNQAGADAARSGTSDVGGRIDVLRHLSLVRSTELLGGTKVANQYAAAVLVAPDGVRGMAASPTACSVFRLANATADPTYGPPLPCHGSGSLLAYDLASGVLVGCTSAGISEKLIYGLDGGGAPKWSIAPADLGIVGNSAPGQPTLWGCMGAADDGAGNLVVSLAEEGAPGRGRLLQLDAASGKVAWQTAVSGSLFGSPATDPGVPDAAQNGNDKGLIPGPPTLAPGGILLAAFSLSTFEMAAAWFTRDGRPIGAVLPETVHTPGTTRHPSGSESVAAEAGAGALFLGDRILMIDPTTAAPIALNVTTDDDLSQLTVTPPARWMQQTVAVPLVHSVAAFNPAPENRHQVWGWEDSKAWTLSESFFSAAGDLFVLEAQRSAHPQAALVLLDGATGVEAMRWRMPLTPVFDSLLTPGDPTAPVFENASLNFFRWFGRPLPMGQGELLVWDLRGNAVILGPASPKELPELNVTRYPKSGVPVELHVHSDFAGLPVDTRVYWGDGGVDVGPTFTHTYHGAATREVRASATYADGTTRTGNATLFVDGSPPVTHLANLTEAAPAAPSQASLGNRLLTGDYASAFWGLLGLVIAVVGGALTFWGKRKSRNWLELHLAELDRIRHGTAGHPESLWPAVQQVRARIGADRRRGRLGEAQYAALALQLEQTVRGLVKRLLAPYGTRIGPTTRMLLEAALEDAAMEETERQHLVRALGQEPALTPPERETLARLFSAP
ncbi:MAG: PKD domain-containing protein [Thermoplasmatota archaeon]